MVFAMVVFTLLSGPVAAGVNCNLDKFSDHPQCNGGVDPEGPNTLAGWSGDYLSEQLRGCHLGDMHPDGTFGHYKCDLNEQAVISFDLPQLPDFETYKGGVQGLCAKFDDIWMAPNTNYVYAWGDKPCVSGSCEIHILNWFYESENENQGIEGVGLINLDAYGWTREEFDSIPFAEDQLVDVYEINLTLKAEGKNRAIATCKWIFEPSEIFFVSNKSQTQ